MARRRRWRDSVATAVMRVVRRSGRRTFSSQELIEHELDRIVAETDAPGERRTKRSAGSSRNWLPTARSSFLHQVSTALAWRT